MITAKELIKIEAKYFKENSFVLDVFHNTANKKLFIKRYKDLFVTFRPIKTNGWEPEDISTDITISHFLPEMILANDTTEGAVVRRFSLIPLIAKAYPDVYNKMHLVPSTFKNIADMAEFHEEVLKIFEKNFMPIIYKNYTTSKAVNTKKEFLINIVNQFEQRWSEFSKLSINDLFALLKEELNEHFTERFRYTLKEFYPDGEKMLVLGRQSFYEFFSPSFEKKLKTEVDKKNKYYVFFSFMLALTVEDEELQVLTQQKEGGYRREDRRSLTWSTFMTYIEYPKRKEWAQLSENHDTLFTK